MSAAPARDHRGYLGIGEVLAELRAEFPDISVSKIRFLDSAGLIEPARSAGGYRRFAAADVDRLRQVLTMQRDEYLPLRVIRDRLAELDAAARRQAGARLDGDGDGAHPRRLGVEPSLAPDQAPLTRRELLAAAEISDALLTELETFGLVRHSGSAGRLYSPEAVAVARAAAALMEYGLEPRHLRTVLAAAAREVSLIEQMVAPMLRQRGSRARAAATATAFQIAALAQRLHRGLVETALTEAGFNSTAQTADGPSG
jgi:DNA-binding transcriptional MerR regulator